MQIVDLRSDTFTQPTEKMKKAMMAAPLGDDVFREDPTVLELEEKVADLLGKEAVLFCPTGVMANQIALGCQLSSGDQVLGAPDNHVYRWEQGAIARHWGASYKEVSSKSKENSVGVLDAEDFKSFLQPDDPHYTVSRLICLENTLNFGGGLIYPQEKIKEIRSFADKNGLKMHLDGARLFNAHVASEKSLKELSEPFDTVSICLSKGLGCPVGSLVLGKKELIHKKGIRLRKFLGGGMRQAGMLAAAGLYAISNHVERLEEDHKAAQKFSKALLENDLFTLEYPVETNMVWFRVKEKAPFIQEAFEKKGVKLLALTDQLLRAVFHLDVTTEAAKKACDIARNLKGNLK